ncbi:SGNH hydrolase [Piromyces finnis]|uniref:SGNH hydrolase n=1 Tax=Piromyces finnis TaxID=1754191 RepID=A0A1Y1VGY8_9FUNG|nr:SGNH hydrolase [Piromyces finnis]|eukprot:ORX55969.1 SGNH hydrolase [Piromyces finnis]
MYNIKNFVLFGDSITELGFKYEEKGWAILLADKYIRKVDIINRGFSGYNTEHAIELFPRIFSKENCKNTLLMTIFFGANDAGVNGEQMLSSEKYIENIRKLINLSLETFPDNCPIIVITPPPCFAKKFNDYRGIYKHENKRTEEFRNFCLSTIQEFSGNSRIFSIDIWEEILGKTWNTESEEYDKILDGYLSDGLHLNGKANEILYNKLIELIKANFPHLISEEMPMNGPYWRDIDPKKIKEAFDKNQKEHHL